MAADAMARSPIEAQRLRVIRILSNLDSNTLPKPIGDRRAGGPAGRDAGPRPIGYLVRGAPWKRLGDAVRAVILLGSRGAAAHPRGSLDTRARIPVGLSRRRGSSMLRTLLSCGALGLAIVSLGCAEIAHGPRTLVDETVLSTRRQVHPNRTSRATVEQTGTEIRVTATQVCDLIEVKEVRRTFETDLENKALVPEIALLSVGAVPAGLGVLFLVDSPNVYDNDRNARQFNASGKSGAVAAGVVFLTWGVAIMTVPVIDFVRAAGSEDAEETTTEEGPVLRRDIPCEGGVVPAAHRSVSGRIPGDFFQFGQTDASGMFTVDLVAAVPSRIFESSRPPTSLDVLVDNAVVGTVSLAGVDEIQSRDRRQQDAAAWAKVDVIACRSASPDQPACDEVRAYMQQFPNGEHLEKARKLLDPTARSSTVQVAASPEDIAKAEAARKKAAAAAEAAKKAAADACRKKCEASCKKDAACSQICVEEACQ
jgi:hypothetical protein